MTKVPLKAVLKECRRRGISFSSDPEAVKKMAKEAGDIYGEYLKIQKRLGNLLPYLSQSPRIENSEIKKEILRQIRNAFSHADEGRGDMLIACRYFSKLD